MHKFMAITSSALLSAVLLFTVGTQLAFADITIKVGYQAGGGYDVNARLVARHLGRFLDGEPDLHVENVPGGGSIRLTKMMLETEPADGTVLGVVDSFLPLVTVLNGDFSEIDMTEFKWLGGIGTKEERLCAVRSSSGVKSVMDLAKPGLKFGATGVGSYNDAVTNVLRNVTGGSFKVVSGFTGTSSLRAAVLRGEIDGFCAMRYRDVGAVFEDGMMQPITQANIHHDRDKGVPHIREIINDKSHMEAVEAFITSERFRFAFFAPGATPDDTVERLRLAFSEMLTDTIFLEEAASLKLVPAPETGVTLQLLASEMRATTEILREKISNLIINENR